MKGNPEYASGEFIIDGVPFLEHCERATKQEYGLVSPIGWTTKEHQLLFAERLLLSKPSVLESGRQPILFCSLCADLGCGCISAKIESDGENYIWNEIGYENDYEPDDLILFKMGSLTFSNKDLTHELNRFVEGLT
ncbi:MAG: hypothetical protein COA78_10215 [Blastopirellula sp.]|nr:MAG: hypothetical protein COA78_10215 [Blastopirellula sp.]